MNRTDVQALNRFGLGRKGSEPLSPDPVRWLRAQLQTPDPARMDGLPSTAQALAVFREYRRQHQMDNSVRPEAVRAMFRADAAAELGNALDSAAPFRERLVWFWSNHFAVSRRRPVVTAVAGAFVREAIRPHVTGRFSDMLLAVMRHPAMLLYLDNAGSFGPNSPAGLRRHRGLNENLARECLELHTVGAAAGYSQTDVTEFARILTGWSVDLRSKLGFKFRTRAHEPGTKVLMNRVFPPGEAGGVEALRFLAAHPATHRHLATKLAVHFIADDPPADAVRRIEGMLRDTGGDLGAAALELTALEPAWQPLTKLRTPQDYVVACLRALGCPPASRANLLPVLSALGQPIWQPPLPSGWPDRAPDWAASENLMRRFDWAYQIAGQAGEVEPLDVGETSLGPLLRPATREAMQHAGSRRDSLTLLLASPEFLRR
jgi:uncharacterized protein (DUF1800 family)